MSRTLNEAMVACHHCGRVAHRRQGQAIAVHAECFGAETPCLRCARPAPFRKCGPGWCEGCWARGKATATTQHDTDPFERIDPAPRSQSRPPHHNVPPHVDECRVFPPSSAASSACALPSLARDESDARLDWRTLPWLCLDTETTGVDIEHDRVVELGIVAYERGETIESRGMLLNPGPGFRIPAEASAVHGITNEQVAWEPTLEAIAPRLLAWMQPYLDRGAILVGYNVLHFDLPLMRNRCPGFAEATAGVLVLDPITLVRLPEVGKFWRGQGRHKLGAVGERFGIQPRGELHRATTDAIMAADILMRLADHLPADAEEAAHLTLERSAQQQADFERWLAAQPPREQAAGGGAQ